MDVVEINVWSRTKGGPRKILHHAVKEVHDPKERDRVIRKMLAEADDKFVKPEHKTVQWKRDHS